MAQPSTRTDIEPQHLHLLPRYAVLKRHRDYYGSSQYEGRPDFFTGQQPDGRIAPLRERKPCIIYPLPRSATNQVVRFTFGESRFPSVNVDEVDADESALGIAVSKEQSETLEKYISQLIDTSQLKVAMRRIMRPGLATGTSVAIIEIKRGRFTLRSAEAENVLPTFRNGDPNEELERAIWSYQYEQTVRGPDNKPEQKRFWYRQDITSEAYIEYEPEPVEEGVDPIWRVRSVVAHGFGFCPVVWIRNLTDEDKGDIDGCSLYEGLLDEFDALNFALSQRHRGINHFGTPQPWETGVPDGDGPNGGGGSGPAGFSAPAATPHGKLAQRTRKGGPDQVWSYESKDVRLGVIETSGKAFEVASNHVNDIRSRALEAMSVVLVNVSEVMGRTQQGEMSAKFLELAYEPLLALVDEMRHSWWFDGLQKILSMMLRITAVLDGERLIIPGASKAAPILRSFFVDTDEGVLWMPPTMTPSWGEYFSAGPDEIGKAVETAGKAKEAGLVPEEDAAKYVLPLFGREDTAEALEEIEQDKVKAQEEAAELAAQQADEQPPNEPRPVEEQQQ